MVTRQPLQRMLPLLVVSTLCLCHSAAAQAAASPPPAPAEQQTDSPPYTGPIVDDAGEIGLAATSASPPTPTPNGGVPAPTDPAPTGGTVIGSNTVVPTTDGAGASSDPGSESTTAASDGPSTTESAAGDPQVLAERPAVYTPASVQSPPAKYAPFMRAPSGNASEQAVYVPLTASPINGGVVCGVRLGMSLMFVAVAVAMHVLM